MQLAYAPVHWAFIAWFALAPALWLLRTAVRPWHSFQLGFVWGGVYHAFRFAWLEHTMAQGNWPPILHLLALCAVVGGLSTAQGGLWALAWVSGQRHPWGAAGMLALLWSGWTWLARIDSSGLLAWSSLAVGQAHTWIAYGIVPWLGDAGLVLLIGLTNASWVGCAVHRKRIARWGRNIAFPLTLLGAALLLLAVFLRLPSQRMRPVVQGSVSQAQNALHSTSFHALLIPGEPSLAQLRRKTPARLRSALLRQTQSIAPLDRADPAFADPGAVPAQLALWPESALGGTPVDRLELEQIRTRLPRRVDLLFGGDLRQPGGLRNAAWLLSAGESLRYDKQILVPFGESLPKILRGWLPGPLVGGESYRAGEGVRVLPWRGTQLGLAICFEGILPAHMLALAREGAGATAVLANLLWLPPYARTHFRQLLALRNLESGVPILLAAHGSAGALFEQGRADPQLPPAAMQASLRVLVQPAAHPAPWVRWGTLLLATTLLGLWLGGSMVAGIFSGSASAMVSARLMRHLKRAASL